MNRLQPLALPRSNAVSKQAFEGDLLNRRKLAEKLTGYLDRLREGAVLAIDARWGEGKTWFGCNWAKYLESEAENHKVWARPAGFAHPTYANIVSICLY